jgi:hypothetical protein
MLLAFKYTLVIMHATLALPTLLFTTASLASDYLSTLPYSFKPRNASK